MEIGILTFFIKWHFKFFIMFPQSKSNNLSNEQWLCIEYSLKDEIYIESMINMLIYSTPEKKIS